MKKHLIVLLAALAAGNAHAQETPSRKYLSGNWNGVRDRLEEGGLLIRPRVTVFNHNFVSGEGDPKSVFNGKAQLEVKLKGRALGLSKWTLVTKAEHNFGEALHNSGRTLIPKNTAITFPGFREGERFDISSAYLAFAPKPGRQVLLGKINMVDLAAGTPFSGGAGLDAFWSVGLAAPVSGITPPYILGAVSTISGKKLRWTFMAYDPVSAVRKTGLEAPFREGIVLSASPSANVNIGGLPGSHAVRVAFSTQSGKNLYNLGDINPPVPVPLTDKDFRYYASYSFNQTLKQVDATNGWGLFGQIAFSDGNPNPLDWSFFVGLGGSSFFPNRAQDRWGIGLYNYSLSPILAQKAQAVGITLRDEIGLETFYQYWPNSWFSIGGNVQVINPMIQNNKTAVFLGLRSSVKL